MEGPWGDAGSWGSEVTVEGPRGRGGGGGAPGVFWGGLGEPEKGYRGHGEVLGSPGGGVPRAVGVEGGPGRLRGALGGH